MLVSQRVRTNSEIILPVSVHFSEARGAFFSRH